MNRTKFDIRSISDILEIEQVIYRGLRCTDEKSWDEWASCFTDEQTIDFGSVKPPQTIKSIDLAAWVWIGIVVRPVIGVWFDPPLNVRSIS